MPLSRYSETFYPSDLDVLWNVYDRVCMERGLKPSDMRETEHLAAEIVRLRLLGVVNEEELFQAVNPWRELRRA
jgi:hypothetical protein